MWITVQQFSCVDKSSLCVEAEFFLFFFAAPKMLEIGDKDRSKGDLFQQTKLDAGSVEGRRAG